MAFNQDDERERAMVSALNLQQDADRVRHDADAYLEIEILGKAQRIEFECKSAPVDSDFGTGRDTGMRQLTRWSNMHFVFGWFLPRDNVPVRLWYGSPTMMSQWNIREQAYLRPDLEIVKYAPTAVGSTLYERVLGDAEEFTYDDMSAIVKNQWNANAAVGRANLYRARADVVKTGPISNLRYSRAVAEQAVRDRIEYLLARGSTVNNRKISRSYVLENCAEIKAPRWAAALYSQVEQTLSSRALTDDDVYPQLPL